MASERSRKPRTILWIQLFVGLLAVAMLPYLWRLATSPLSVFASGEARLQTYIATAKGAFIPLGAAWVIIALQLRLRKARLSAAGVLSLVCVSFLFAMPDAIASARATGDPSAVLPRVVGAAIIPFLAACLLGALMFEPAVRQYFEVGASAGSSTTPDSHRP